MFSFLGAFPQDRKPKVRMGSIRPSAKRSANDRNLRIAVAHCVGRERPLSRQRCASTPIGFDRLSGERQNSVLRWARAEMLRLDNSLTPEHDRLA
jgi:hypothetical protein